MTEHAYKDRTITFRFKQILSYLRPVSIEKRTGILCPSLEVTLESGCLVLNAGGYNYSFGHVEAIFALALGKYNPAKRKIKNALLLGFGAGCIADLLLDEYELEIPVRGVEMDQEVISLYEKYFEDDPDGRIDLIHANALDYVGKCKDSFDFIAVDLFKGSELFPPVPFETFIEQTCSLLKPGGLLFYHCLDGTEEQKRQKESLSTLLRGQQGKTSEIRLPLSGMSNVMLVFER